MSNPNRNILISCAVLFVVACVCLSIIAIGGVSAGLITRRASSSAETQVVTVGPVRAPTQVDTATQVPVPNRTPAAPSIQAPSPTAGPGASPTPTPTPCPEGACPTPTPEAVLPIPPDVAKQLDTIEEQVVEYRGLSPNKTVTRHLISPDQLRERVLSDLLKDYTPDIARSDSLVYGAAGLLPPNFDLLDLYKKLYSEGIAGFYDDKTNEMFVIQGQSFGGNEKLTYSHEYTHALQFQNFDIHNGLRYDDAPCKNETDRCAAIQSVIEGDATVSEQYWLINFSSPQDKRDIAAFQNNLQLPVYDSAPLFIQDDFTFPYREGASFVSDIYNQGGWAAVNKLFTNPPISTEQILHPERFPDDKPVKVDLPDLTATLGEGWKELDRDEMGAWYTYLILTDSVVTKARLPHKTAQTATDRWGGDQYLYYYDESTSQGVFALVTQWDTEIDATGFAKAFQTYGAGRWAAQPTVSGTTLTWSPDGTYVSFTRSGQKTTWIIAPNQPIADSVNAALK